MPETGPFTATSALAGPVGKQGEGSPDAGVHASEITGLGIATVMVRKDKRADLNDRLAAAFGITLPDGPRRASACDVALIGTGPATWLAVSQSGENGFASLLRAQVGDSASIADQTDGYAVIRIAGRAARATLAKGLAIDLHPRAFAIDGAASSSIAQIGVTLWQVDSLPTYEIALFRSYAGSFWHWLSISSAEFGLATGNGPAGPG